MRNRSPERTAELLNQKDLRALRQLEINLEKWIDRAKKCGCGNCWRDAERVYQKYLNEHKRLLGDHEDHEELGLMNFALMRLEERKNDQ